MGILYNTKDDTLEAKYVEEPIESIFDSEYSGEWSSFSFKPFEEIKTELKGKEAEENIDSDLILYRSIINKYKRFIIPSLQRSYKWSYEAVDVLLDKIYNSTKSFTFGLITIDSNVKVIDGQQRLTTLAILEKVLNNKVSFELYIERLGECYINSLTIKEFIEPWEFTYIDIYRHIQEYMKGKDNNLMFTKLNTNLKLMVNEINKPILNEYLNINEHKIGFLPYDLIRANQIVNNRDFNISKIYDYISKKLYDNSNEVSKIIRGSSVPFKRKDKNEKVFYLYFKYTSSGLSENYLDMLYAEDKEIYYSKNFILFLDRFTRNLFDGEEGLMIAKYLRCIVYGELLNKVYEDRKVLDANGFFGIVYAIYISGEYDVTLKLLSSKYPEYKQQFIAEIFNDEPVIDLVNRPPHVSKSKVQISTEYNKRESHDEDITRMFDLIIGQGVNENSSLKEITL